MKNLWHHVRQLVLVTALAHGILILLPNQAEAQSCEGNCGGYVQGVCGCDEACWTFGDCCSDVCAECTFTGPEWVANCGGGCESIPCSTCVAVPNTCVTDQMAYENVIAIFPSCCDSGWDSVCQNYYDILSSTCTDACSSIPCADCIVVPDACVEDQTAYNIVITNNPSCCDSSWDSTCQDAYDAISSSCSDVYEPCSSIPCPNCNPVPDCVTNQIAYNFVIANNPNCCNDSWDTACQEAYNELEFIGYEDFGSGCQNSGLIPLLPIVAPTMGGAEIISTFTTENVFSIVQSVEKGQVYEFTSDGNSWITIYFESVDGILVAEGYSPLSVLAYSPGDFYVNWNSDENCGTSDESIITTVECITCDDLCSAGWYTWDGVCELCPPGFYCPGDGFKYLCPAGKYSCTSGAVSCESCPAGYYSYPGSVICELCDADTGLEACVADCNGVFGGTAYLDECATCVGGDTGLEACIQDCNGDWGGTAFLDNCATCVGGNTGLEDCEAGTYFITTWKTDNLGDSNSSSITIPTTGTGYNYDVSWSNDGVWETGVTGDASHTYDSPGTYTVAIRGDFPRIYFNNGGDKEKLLSIEQWGAISWSSMQNAFYGCVNLIGNATDTPHLSSVTNMSGMFRYASSFNQDLGNWDLSNVTEMPNMFANVTLSTENYDNTLIGWATDSSGVEGDGIDDIPNAINFHGGNSLYCVSEPGRQNLIDTYGWAITDGGISSPVITAIADVSVCEEFTLPPITGTNLSGDEKYYSETNGGGITYSIGDVLSYADFSGYPVTLYAFDTSTSGCSGETDFALTIHQNDISSVTFQDVAETYDGTTRSLVVSGLPIDASVIYTNNDQTDAGVYEVTATISSTNESCPSVELTATLTIHKAQAVITAISPQTFTYDGTVKNVSAILDNAEGMLTYSPQQGYTEVGTYAIAVSAAETNNYLSASENVTLTINDETAPVPDLATLPVIEGECSVMAAYIPIPTATDDSQGEITATTSDPLEYTEQGTYTITWIYDDSYGNTVVQTQSIVVSDTTAPTIICAADGVRSGSEGYTVTGSEFDPISVSDNCAESPAITHNAETLFGSQGLGNNSLAGWSIPMGDHTITFTVSDGINSATCDVSIQVSGISISGNATMNMSCTPLDIRIELYEAGTPNLNPILVETYSATIDANGDYSVGLAGLVPGTYGVYIKVDTYLQQFIGDILLDDATVFDLSYLQPGDIAGNAFGDNVVDGLDLSLLIIAFNTQVGDEKYNEIADLNCDQVVDALDMSLLIYFFNDRGDSPQE